MKTTRKNPSITAGSLGENRGLYILGLEVLLMWLCSWAGSHSLGLSYPILQQMVCECPSSTHMDHMQCENCFFLTPPLIQVASSLQPNVNKSRTRFFSLIYSNVTFPKINRNFASKMDTSCQGNPLQVEDNTAILCKDNDSLFNSKKIIP